MEFWQIWYMRRTENPENVVRVHETPQHGGDSSAGRALECGSRGHGFESLSSHKYILEAWVSGLNHLPAKEALPLRGSKVRIFPFPQKIIYLCTRKNRNTVFMIRNNNIFCNQRCHSRHSAGFAVSGSVCRNSFHRFSRGNR